MLHSAFGALAFAVDNDLEFRNQIHRQADMSGELAEGADGLDVHLLAFHFKADLLSERGGNILRGDRAVQFTRIASLGSESEGYFLNRISEALELFIL